MLYVLLRFVCLCACVSECALSHTDGLLCGGAAICSDVSETLDRGEERFECAAAASERV